MRRIYKKMFKIFAFIILLFVVILLAVYINHRIRLDKEQELLVPLGEMISVDGNNMSVYKEGSGDKTLVFLCAVCEVGLLGWTWLWGDTTAW